MTGDVRDHPRRHRRAVDRLAGSFPFTVRATPVPPRRPAGRSWVMTRRTDDVLMWMLSTKMMPRRRRADADLSDLPATIHLIDTRLGIGFLLMMVNLPIIIWMLYTYFKEIPVDILEAARMDGAALLNEIIYVLTPMAMPGIASTHAACRSSCPGTRRSGRSI